MKLSPISILYRGIQRSSSIAFLAIFLVATDFALPVGGPLLVGSLTAVAILAVIAYEVAYYQRFEYTYTEDTFDISSGVISRRDREIPYRRIQNVDITRNVIQRLLGLAAVNIETAGGAETEGVIRFVSAEAAETLQRELDRRKQHGSKADDTEPEPSTSRELYRISPLELGLIGALSFDARIFGLVAIVASGSVPFLMPAIQTPDLDVIISVFGLALLVLLTVTAWLVGVALTALNFYGFTLTQSSDELRYERGLLQRYSGSIPLSKIQTISLTDNPLKRIFKYATLTVETAGYAPSQGGGGKESQAAVPIASRDRVYALAAELEDVTLADVSFERPPTRVRYRYAIRYVLVLGVLTVIGFGIDTVTETPLPWYVLAGMLVFIPLAAHLKWKHRGYWIGPDHAITRNGFWRRSIKIVPYYRIQTIIESQTILQRRWQLATVMIDTASSHSLIGTGAAAIDIDEGDAAELRRTLNTDLQEALIDRTHHRYGFDWIGEAHPTDPAIE